MQISIAISLTSAALRRGGAVPPWTPATLFANGEIGHWPGGYDPASGRVWQNNTGTTPATTFDQPAGLVNRLAGTQDAAQATVGSRPTTARWPKGGRRNLFTWTEDFGQSIWVKTNATPAQVDGPVWGLIETAATGEHGVYHNGQSVVSGETYSTTWEVKAAGRDRLRFIGVSSTWGSNVCMFDLDAGTYSITGAGTASILPLEDGWRRISYSQPAIGTHSGATARHLLQTVNDAGQTNYTGDGVSGLLIRRPQRDHGAATPYQRVTTAHDVTEAGVPDVWHLWNDGGDSLPIVLPAGDYGLAWVDHLGDVTIDTIASDGSTPIDTLRAERQADVILRQGALTPDEQAALTAYWEGLYA